MKKQAIYCLLLTILICGCGFSENEVIIIPKGFKGNVLIIFNQKSGVPAQYEEGKRVYKIPLTGILKTQLSANDGWSKFPIFYYDEINEKNLLPYYPALRDVKDMSVVFAHGGSVGSIIKDIKTEERIYIKAFQVGTKSEVEGYYSKVQKIDIINLTKKP